jgi:hypothetical protein
MILRVWILGILLIVIIWYLWTFREGFQGAPTYTLPTPASSETVRTNFASILNEQKTWNKGVRITQSLGVLASGSGSAAGSQGSGSGSKTTQQLLEAVTNPGPKDTFNVIFPNYISMYALAKYNMNPVAARYALINNYDALQDEIVTNIPNTDELASTCTFTAAPQQTACSELNAFALSLYGEIIKLTAAVVDLSGTEILAEAVHEENRAFQGSSACVNQGPTPSAACIKLASQDETLFPILHNYDAANVSLQTNGETVQTMLNTVLQTYRGLGCTMPTAGPGQSITSVFSEDYLENLGIINTEQLSMKLQELSPYYVSPNTISYITRQLIATSEFNTNMQDATSYIASMAKQTNALVSLTTTFGAGSFYAESGSGGIMVCPAGYVCYPTSTVPSICPVGSYCPAGTTSTPPKCPSGTYSPQGASSEEQCTTNMPSGYYPVRGVATICPAGAYCPAGTITPVACPRGTYNPSKGKTAATSCLPCPAGSYCMVPKTGFGSTYATPCAAGTYSSQTNADVKTVCIPCPAGRVCASKGMSAPLPCPAGTYSSATGLATTCTPLPGGVYSSITGATNTSSASMCQSGYYCPGGNATQTLCPKGSFCPSSSLTSPTLCPAGTYGNTLGQTSSACSGNCAAGYYCPAGSVSATEGKCPAGYYCPAATTAPIICPQGKFCPFGSSSPTMCPVGTYNIYTGKSALTDCLPCDAGTYCNTQGSPGPPCPIGNYCPTSSTSPVPCPPGTYCAATGLIAPTACPTGTFGTTVGATSLSACQQCVAGTYNIYTGQTSCSGICAVGYYCEAGSTIQNPCPAGSYCPSDRMSTPTPCPAGTYGATAGITVSGCSGLCAIGYYCPAGSTGQYGGSATTAAASTTRCQTGYCTTPGGRTATG